ncbi:unnamed protein product [Ambrosiozyma monospora]|uniref:Unnamed protein product n=1 Tax=Ambrosiozyma monospora TaxID=43982 RepID=A0ACB5TE63_AMBMO|nr:unnamed protein product [Ambrosiozyma monospora]
MSILEDLDKQVEQYYRRRINVTPKKSKKKGHHNAHKDETHLVTNASFKSLLEKRSKWIEKIGPLFKSQLEMRRMPEESIFEKVLNGNGDDNDDDENEGDVEDGDEVDDVVLSGRKNGDDVGEVESLVKPIC